MGLLRQRSEVLLLLHLHICLVDSCAGCAAGGRRKRAASRQESAQRFGAAALRRDEWRGVASAGGAEQHAVEHHPPLSQLTPRHVTES